MQRVWKKTVVSLCCFLMVAGHLNAQTTTDPNIIFIIADDLNDYVEGYDANPDLHTPNINLLRNNGATFLNAIAAAPICAPSRTAILTGKDLNYTQVYKNGDHEYVCYNFDLNFTEELGNAFHITMPEYFKDSLGYYTYNLNKIFHCHTNYLGYDQLTADPCEKNGMWNNYFVYDDSIIIDPVGAQLNQGVPGYDWAAIPDSMEKYLSDVVSTDSAIAFIDRFASTPASTCDKPFLMMLGYAKPHKKQYIPEHYFPDAYVPSVAGEFDIPYNFPKNTYPPNGITLPPQPEVPFSDVDAFPPGGMARTMVKKIDTAFMHFSDDIYPLPVIDEGLTNDERRDIIAWSMRANGQMAYIAAVQLVDTQLGRLIASLQEHPEVMNNTIVVLIGDHGYSLGQKRHWGKYAMWDADLRTTCIITDFRNPGSVVVNTPVSLIDIFPSLLEMTGKPMPTFPDGSDYFDGLSMMPLMDAEAPQWERPLISSVKKLNEDDLDGSCYPQYSIRSDRFHLIRYQSNGGGYNNCQPDLSAFEYELYEIGEHRETDPYEWHNLADDPDYAPIEAYLMQWLPEGSMYLKRAYSLNMQLPSNCLLDLNEPLMASLQITDTLGNAMSPSADFMYTWTNNMNADIFYGADVSIDLNAWNNDILEHDGSFYLYCTMTDPSTGSIVGIDMRRILTNEASIPAPSFTASIVNGATVYITDIQVGENATSWWWDFGEGPVYRDEMPGPYTFASAGDHTITLTVQYGNTSDCFVEDARVVKTTPGSEQDMHMLLFPNPVSETLHVIIDDGYNSQFTIYDMAGRVVSDILSSFDESVHLIDVSHLPDGVYCLVAGSGEGARPKTFVVIHP